MCYGIIPRIFHIGARWVLVVSVTEAGCLPVGQSLLYPLISLGGSQGSSWPYDREENLLSAIIIQHQFLGRGAPSLDGKHTEICSLFFCGTLNISKLYLDSCFTHSRSDVLQQHKIINTNLKEGLTSFRSYECGDFPNNCHVRYTFLLRKFFKLSHARCFFPPPTPLETELCR